MPSRKSSVVPRNAHPPMRSKYISGPTDLEIQALRRLDRNEKARVHMARNRAALKLQPIEDQQAAAVRARQHQKTYREKHREERAMWEAERRIKIYTERFGVTAYAAFLRAKRDCRRRKKAKARAKEAYHGNDEEAIVSDDAHA